MSAQLLTSRYRIVDEIGRGGMAIVYRCIDAKHQRTVAVKVFRADLAATVGATRFLREIAITASLNHPHILPLLDSGADQDALYYVMPYVAGGSLRRLLRARNIPVDAVTRITREVASALDYAHAQGVIHRDVKPENILFNEGLAIASDFGIAHAIGGGDARMTGTGTSIGTLGYMSPEQALGTVNVDARTDVYSLGCVVYEMLVGATPSNWPGPEDVELGRFADLPAAHRARFDELPGRLEQVLVRALALRPQHRFAAAGEFAAALDAASEHTTRFGDEEVRQLLSRAAQLQKAADDDSSDRITLGGVEQIAAQVGIPPAHVRAAALDMDTKRAAVLRSGPQPRWDRLAFTETLAGEIPAEVFPAMVARIERHIGVAGHATVIGRALTWSPAAQREEGRKVVVQVAAQEGTTTIRLQENIDVEGGRKLAIPAGIIIGGGFGGALAFALGMGEPTGPVLAILCAISGVFSAIRLATWVAVTDRGPGLERLKNELTAIASAAINERT